MPLLPCGWECVPLPTRRQCRKECDDLSGHEAAEISSATLLRQWRRGRWRSSSRLFIALCGVGAHALYTVAQSIVKTATLLRVAVVLWIRLPPSAFRVHRFPTSTNRTTMSKRLSWMCVILSDAMIVGDRPQARLRLRGPFPTRPPIRPPRLQSSCSLRRRVQVDVAILCRTHGDTHRPFSGGRFASSPQGRRRCPSHRFGR